MSILGKVGKVAAGAASGFLGGGGIGGAVKGGLDAATGGSAISKVAGAFGRKTPVGNDMPSQGGITGTMDTKVIKKRRSMSGGRSLSGR